MTIAVLLRQIDIAAFHEFPSPDVAVDGGVVQQPSDEITHDTARAVSGFVVDLVAAVTVVVAASLVDYAARKLAIEYVPYERGPTR